MSTQVTEATVQEETDPVAPPTYGDHELDEFYSDIDPSGIMTPAPRAGNLTSGVTTPIQGTLSAPHTPFDDRSRTHSFDNTRSDMPLIIEAPSNQGVPASQIHSRLANLQVITDGTMLPNHESGESITHPTETDTSPSVGWHDPYF